MLDLDLLDERHVSIVQEAIAEDRIGLVVQNMHTFDGPGHVLYGECLPRLTGRDGTKHEDTVFVPALEALGAAPLLSRHMIKLVLDALESDPLSVLGYSLSDDNVSDPANWAHIRDQIAARSQLASRLVLRFTAIRPFADAALVSALLSEARALGCRVATDDLAAERSSKGD